MSILDSDIDFYQASLEHAEYCLRKCYPKDEAHYLSIIEVHKNILNEMKKLKAIYNENKENNNDAIS